MATIRAVVVDSGAPARLTLGEVEAPVPRPGEALVRVAAISLNRGEVRAAQTSAAGSRPGWDFAGSIETPAADGVGPRDGDRVVGVLRSGGWGELVAAPTHSLAVLPEKVSFEQAATLPVAGLTALYALERGGLLLGRDVLVTGASGGVGHFAVQLAKAAGANVVGLVRQQRHADAVREAGAYEVVADESGEAAARLGPYHLVLDSVGGAVLAAVLKMLAPGGVCVAYGVSAGADVTFDAGTFMRTGSSYQGLLVFNEFAREPARIGLGRLAEFVADGRLRPLIALDAPWSEVGATAQALLDRTYPGKAVLRVTN